MGRGAGAQLARRGAKGVPIELTEALGNRGNWEPHETRRNHDVGETIGNRRSNKCGDVVTNFPVAEQQLNQEVSDTLRAFEKASRVILLVIHCW
jgi:hypothetical protein